MLTIGTFQELTVARRAEPGLYLADPQGGEVLLPNSYVPEGAAVGDRLRVFLYKDSEDRLVATTRQPRITPGEFAYLPVSEVTRYGAFLDWGIEKELLVPFREQDRRMVEGRRYLVYCYVDVETDRLVASARADRFLKKEKPDLSEGEEVDLLIGESTELGVKVIVNQAYGGLIYHDELFQKIHPGERRKGYVRQVREDHKLDISLQPPGYRKVEPNAEKILQKLEEEGGFLGLSDKSPPAEIYRQLEMSKKTFKKAIGALYKERVIRIEPDGIYLVQA